MHQLTREGHKVTLKKQSRVLLHFEESFIKCIAKRQISYNIFICQKFYQCLNIIIQRASTFVLLSWLAFHKTQKQSSDWTHSHLFNTVTGELQLSENKLAMKVCILMSSQLCSHKNGSITYKLFKNILLSNNLTTTMYTTKINFHINKLYGIHLSL